MVNDKNKISININHYVVQMFLENDCHIKLYPYLIPRKQLYHSNY